MERPILKLEMGPADLILEILPIISLLVFFGFTLYQFSRLPETIPTHFNGSGEPDDYGSKYTLWILPLVALVIYAILSLVSKIPEKLNYPVKITPANARKQYILSIRLLRYLKLAMILMFFFISYQTTMIAQHKIVGLGPFFIPIYVGMIMIPVIVYYILAQQSR